MDSLGPLDPLTPTAADRQAARGTEAEPGGQGGSSCGEEDDTSQRRLAYFQRTTAGFVAHLSRLKEAS